MKSTEERVCTMLELEILVAQWLDSVEQFGNENASTDSIIELIQKKANQL